MRANHSDRSQHSFVRHQMLAITLTGLICYSFCVSEEEHLAKMIGKPPPPKDLTIESLYDPDECEMTTKVGHQVKV